MDARYATRVITSCVMCYVSCVIAVAAEEVSPVTAELIAEHASLSGTGNAWETRIGVHVELEPGWHIYAQEPGDAGLPTTVTWSVPGGVTVGPLHWPTPQTFVDPGDIQTFGYSGTLVLYSPLSTIPKMVEVNPVPISAKVTWLACRDICIPGSAELTLSLPYSLEPPAFSTHAQLFEQTE